MGKLMAGYLKTKDADSIPLPVSKPKNVVTRGLRGLFYEVGARIYHLAQRRTNGF
jgi:hypothetical protein